MREIIEEKRDHMVTMAERLGLQSELTVQRSQELDNLIIMEQREKLNRHNLPKVT